jgi:hypothetical protein
MVSSSIFCEQGQAQNGCSLTPFVAYCNAQCLTPPVNNRDVPRTVRVINRCTAPVWVGAVGNAPMLAPGFTN